VSEKTVPRAQASRFRAHVSVADPAERAYRDVRAYIARLRVRLRKKGIRVHAHVLLGPVVGTIADIALREHPVSRLD
jgi:hypothetical protein